MGPPPMPTCVAASVRKRACWARPPCTIGSLRSIPLAAERIHPNDLRRIIRALEVFELTGQPISAWQTIAMASRAGSPTWIAVAEAPVPASCLWLELPRP